MHSLFENWFTELKGVVIGDNRVQTTISQLARSLPPILLTKSWSVPYPFLNINACHSGQRAIFANIRCSQGGKSCPARRMDCRGW